jgi:serine/threonine-protein kinase
MAVAVGTWIGAYEVVAPLGAGGMGEVYRARDTKLNRDVALKILPEAFALDGDRIARFRREAQVLASLNHPNIAAIYGFEDSGSIHALVLELVEGPTLADRIAQGPIPLDEALLIARQIAEALEAAHEQGIIHRDLKPANIKVRDDGTVTGLDFGLAKLLDAAPAATSGSRPHSPGLTNSPTMTTPAMTMAGVILGTAAYMSPEQAKGLVVDHRCDVFSFGAVLYEMLTGKQAFQGDTVSDVLASVLARDPDVSLLPPNVNPRLVDLVRRCLDKNPKRRWQAVGDLRIELETIARAPRGVPSDRGQTAARPLWKRVAPAAAAAMLATVVTASIVWMLRPSPQTSPVARFVITLPDGQQFTSSSRAVVAISPDGTQIAYVATRALYRRPIGELSSQLIAGTEPGRSNAAGAINPVFSPDGRTIAYFSNADNAIKRVPVGGGTPVVLCHVSQAVLGMSWYQDALLYGEWGKGVMRVSENGGTPEVLLAVESDKGAYGPQMLPDGQTILFTLTTGTPGIEQFDKAQIVTQTPKSQRKTLIDGGSDGRYLPTGHLVYALDGVLLARRFDPRTNQVSGAPVPVIEGIRRSSAGQGTPVAHFSVSDTGTLVYAPGPVSVTSAGFAVALIDRHTGATTPLNIPPGPYEYPRVSPDGTRLAVATNDLRDANIWVYELSGASSLRRLTNGGRNRFPVWVGNDRIAFQSDRDGDAGIYWQRADGSGSAMRLAKAAKGTTQTPESASADARYLLYEAVNGGTHRLNVLSIPDGTFAPFGDVKSQSVLSSSFSPDGRWVIYHVSSALEGTATTPPGVYVEPFPRTGATYLIANAIHPQWSPTGMEIFYRQYGRTFAVPVSTRSNFSFGTPVPVDAGPYRERGPNNEPEIDMLHDGKQFVGVVLSGGVSGAATASQLHVVMNWTEELKQRLPPSNAAESWRSHRPI